MGAQEDPDVAFIAWTTTPWTLPSNLALCVHPELTYVKVRDLATDAVYIMMEARLTQLFPEPKKKKKNAEAQYEVVCALPPPFCVGERFLAQFLHPLPSFPCCRAWVAALACFHTSDCLHFFLLVNARPLPPLFLFLSCPDPPGLL